MLANHALRDKKVILFYFAARSAAQDFAPYLRKAYEVKKVEIFQMLKYHFYCMQASRVEGGGGGVEVVLVSDVRPLLS